MPLSPLRVEIARALAGELLRGLSVWHSLRSSPGTCPTCPDAADDLWCPDLVVAVSAIERARAHRCDRVSERLDVCTEHNATVRWFYYLLIMSAFIVGTIVGCIFAGQPHYFKEQFKSNKNDLGHVEKPSLKQVGDSSDSSTDVQAARARARHLR